MKKILIGRCLPALMLTACSGGKTNTDAVSATETRSDNVISDPKLYPFMLGGVYFFHGYGSAQTFLDKMARGQMTSKPGSSRFNDELHRIYTEYFYYPFKPEDGVGARSTLADSWGMTDKASFRKEMDELITNGHQSSYQRLSAPGGKAMNAEDKERAAFIAAHKTEFPKGGIKAWDIARYVNNTAMGYAAGYITQEEGDAMLAKLPAIAHSAYGSWGEYWKGYNLGRKYWNGDLESDAAFDKDAADMQQGDYSLYKYMKW